MNWTLVLEILYIIFIVLVCIRIILDTRSATKALAYIMLSVFVPVVGVIVYFSIGINYRKRKIYNKNIFTKSTEIEVFKWIKARKQSLINHHPIYFPKFTPLVNLISNQAMGPLTGDNAIKLLVNGEEKFPEVIEALKNAQHHIHIEYYIFEDDKIGQQLIDLIIQKQKEGVEVRFIYDDFGSRSIRKKQVKRMRQAGIQVFPFYKIKLIFLANRLNYRNHRKIVIVDGETGFLGGINVSDKYINDETFHNDLFWRDTHLKIEGNAVSALQYIFIGDWNYCSGEKLEINQHYFPFKEAEKNYKAHKIVQIIASGPDSDTPLIMQSLIKVISLAQEEVLITTPYFIPGESIKEVIRMTALSNVKVKLLVPGISDSKVVNFASRSYFNLLLKAGVEIYEYRKGFVHAKTVVVDGEVAVVGTANMDLRSFDLNFEVNALVYDQDIAFQLRETFYQDLKDSRQIKREAWLKRPKYILLLEKIAGLISPLL